KQPAGALRVGRFAPDPGAGDPHCAEAQPAHVEVAADRECVLCGGHRLRLRVLRSRLELGSCLRAAAERLARRHARSTMARRTLIAWGVGIGTDVAALRVEVVELLRVAALTGLTICEAAVV